MSPDLAKFILMGLALVCLTVLGALHLVSPDALVMAIGGVLGNAVPGLLGQKSSATKGEGDVK